MLLVPCRYKVGRMIYGVVLKEKFYWNSEIQKYIDCHLISQFIQPLVSGPAVGDDDGPLCNIFLYQIMESLSTAILASN